MRSTGIVVLIGVLLFTMTGALAQTSDGLQVIVESVDAEGFPTVQVEVSVRDADRRPVLGLGLDDFAITEDGAAATITAVEDSDLGIAVVLVVDTSDSMFAMPAAREAAQAFVEALGPSDSVALIDFDTNVVTLRPLTTDHQDVIDGIATELEQGGRTALYDGALRGVQEAAGARHGRRMVVLLADGNESGESISGRADALNQANQNGIPVHTIGLGASADRTYLENIAALTGGEYLNAPDSAALHDVYVGLAERLRHAYLLTIESGLPGDGSAHDLNITVNTEAASGSAEHAFVTREIPPGITLRAPNDYSGTVSITPDVDVQGNRYDIAWQLDGNPVSNAPSVPPFTLNLVTTDLAPGEHTLSATITDAAGLQASAELDFEIGLLPPEMEISGLRDGMSLADEVVTVGVEFASQTPIQEVTFQIDDAEPEVLSNGPFSFDIDPLSLIAGEHTLTIIARNESDTPTQQTLTFMATLSPPQVSLSLAPEEAATEPFTIVAEVEDEGSVDIAWTLDGDSLRPNDDTMVEIIPFELEPGSHQLEISATDDDDLTGRASITFEIAALPPELVIDGIFADTTLTDEPLTVDLNITSQTDPDEVSIQIDDEDPVSLANAPYSYQIDPLALADITETEHTFSVRVTDASGQTFEESIPFSTTITPPDVSLSGIPETPASQRFSIILAIEASSPVDVSWLVDGEQVRERRVETNDLLEVDPYAYEAGEYRFSVTAVDDYGLTSMLDGESFEIAALPPLVEVVGLNDADNLLGITDMLLDITSQTPIREVNYSMDGAEIETSSTAPYPYRIDPAVIGADDHTLAITVIAEGGANSERNIDFMVDESAVPSDGLNIVIIAAVVIVLLAALVVGYQVGFAGKLTPIPGGGKVALVYEDVLSGKETRYKIRAERTTIGRSPSNDVTLLDAQQRISREHAAIEARGQKWVVEDLKSRMGVLVNGEKIDGTQAIFDGDMLTIGSVVIRFDAPEFSRSEQDRLETIVEDLPPDFNEGVATVPPPARKRSTRLKVDEPSEADTDEIAAINDPPEPRHRVTLIKEDSTDDDIKAHSEDKTPSSPRKTAIKPAEPETGLIPEAELPAAPEDDTDQTPISSRTPAINRFPAEEEDLRDTTRPELSEPDSEDDTDT